MYDSKMKLKCLEKSNLLLLQGQTYYQFGTDMELCFISPSLFVKVISNIPVFYICPAEYCREGNVIITQYSLTDNIFYLMIIIF